MMPGRTRLASRYPVTPDGRYFMVRGRLWRMANPALDPEESAQLVQELMSARRAVGVARREHDPLAEKAARAAVDEAKRALGERGPVWWTDGAPDLNRHMARNTVYAGWLATLPADIEARAGSVHASHGTAAAASADLATE